MSARTFSISAAPGSLPLRPCALRMRPRMLSRALTVELPEGLPRRGRHVAPVGPAVDAGQAVDQLVAAAHPRADARGDTREGGIKPRPARHERPCAQRRALAEGTLLRVELALAQLAHEIRQRNLHRADHLALPAEGGRVREVSRVLDA